MKRELKFIPNLTHKMTLRMYDIDNHLVLQLVRKKIIPF